MMFKASIPNSLRCQLYSLQYWVPLWSQGSWFRTLPVGADVQGPVYILAVGIKREAALTTVKARSSAAGIAELGKK